MTRAHSRWERARAHSGADDTGGRRGGSHGGHVSVSARTWRALKARSRETGEPMASILTRACLPGTGPESCRPARPGALWSHVMGRTVLRPLNLSEALAQRLVAVAGHPGYAVRVLLDLAVNAALDAAGAPP